LLRGTREWRRGGGGAKTWNQSERKTAIDQSLPHHHHHNASCA
jgi:hypothetical protein